MTTPPGLHDDETIPLEGFLKREGVFPTGGQAKLAIQGGDVLVNGVVETRRKKKIKKGDVVNVAGQDFVVVDLD